MEVDKEELLILAKRIPEPTKKRLLEHPDASCDEKTLDKLMTDIGEALKPRKAKKK